MYKQTLHTLITDFKRLRGGCSSLRIKHLQCCVLGLEPGLCLLYLQWSNKPTQVNNATPLICSSETSSFCILHSNVLVIRRQLSWEDDVYKSEHRGNGDLLSGSVLFVCSTDGAVLQNCLPAGQQEQGSPLKSTDIQRRMPTEMFTSCTEGRGPCSVKYAGPPVCRSPNRWWSPKNRI